VCHHVPTVARSPLLSPVWLVVAFAVATGCGSTATDATGFVCAELFDEGLTGCTEHCRPFAVLHFGPDVLADGTVSWTCECMPGGSFDVQDRPSEGDTPDNEPIESTRDTGRSARPDGVPVAPVSGPASSPGSSVNTAR
jgi:hypothetical protein